MGVLAATAEDRMRPTEPASVKHGHQPLDLLHFGPTVRLTKDHAVPCDVQTITDELFPEIRSDVIEDIERDDSVERCISLSNGFTDRRGRDAKLIAVE